MATIAITGASGFVGSVLCKELERRGDSVIKIGREELKDKNKLISIVQESDTIINLAGAPIAARWNEEYKKILYSSRIETTKALVNAMKESPKKPTLFISTSAVGRYDNKGTYTEDDTNYANDHLGMVTKFWEEEALRAQEIGVRTVIFRFGVVLGYGGGMMDKVYTPFNLGVGGVIGDGKQHFSWIHIEDIVGAQIFAMENSDIRGVYNLVSPEPTNNLTFTKEFGKILKRPTIFPVPVFVLKLIFGEGSTVLSDGQSAKPKRLLDAKYNFKYPTLTSALQEIVKKYRGE